MGRINHPAIVQAEVEGVVGVLGVVRMTTQGFRPLNDLTHILNQGFAGRNRLQGIDPLAVDATSAHLNATASRSRRRGFGPRACFFWGCLRTGGLRARFHWVH